MDESVLQLRSVRKAQRDLRAYRQKAALQLASSAEKEAMHRTNLLPVLSYAAETLFGRESGWSESATQTLVDCAASVALAPGFATRDQELATLAVSVQVLCRQEQFARLHPIAPRLLLLAEQWSNDRPFLAATLKSLAQMWRGQTDGANQTLLRALGLEKTPPPVRATRDTQNGCDFLMASGLRTWIKSHLSAREGDGNIEAMERARTLAVQHGIVSTYELASVAVDYARAVDRCAVTKLLPQYEATFADPKMSFYLHNKPQRTLFPPQRRAIEAGALKEQNVLLTLPTSGGKTLLAEFRILAELQRHPNSKVIYLAPYRTLASQVEEALREGLKSAKLSVKDYGGDVDLGEVQNFSQDEISDVAVMTPEKFDALLRFADSSRSGAREIKEYLASVKLFVWDELQVIGRSGRGPRLELLLARLRQRFPDVPLMALSGVMSGQEKVAQWLGNATVITSDQRPTGILEALWNPDGELQAKGANGKPFKIGNLERKTKVFEATADLVALLETDIRPVLVLESQVGYTVKSLAAIHERTSHAGERWRARLRKDQVQRLVEAAEEVEALIGDELLADCLRSGLALHHGRLPATILRNIERLASEGVLRAIVSTSTVAEGAHLPFRAVVIPHLNFQSDSRRLEKDLYDNIVGRAGRAGVAAEGLIFILGSATNSLKNHVPDVLWKGERAELRSALPQVSFSPANDAEFETLRQVQSQIMAWLGDEGSYIEDQAALLASKTLCHLMSGSPRFSRLCANTFQELERQGLAVAASPFRLTDSGQRARLAGLSSTSCLRLMEFLDDSNAVAWETNFHGIFQLDEDLCHLIAYAVFLTDEVMSHSLWLSSQGNKAQQFEISRRLAEGEIEWPVNDDVWLFDVRLFALWLCGRSLDDLAKLPAPEGTVNSDDASEERIEFLRTHFARLFQPASWAWSGACALTQSQGENVPSWIRVAIECGVPNQTASYLCSKVNLSRTAALKVASRLPAEWSQANDLLLEWTQQEDAELRLTRNDQGRLYTWRQDAHNLLKR